MKPAARRLRRTALLSNARQRSEAASRPGRRSAGRAAFRRRLTASRRRALLLDYDGTLAPLTPDRAHAVPYPGMRAALATIALARRRTAVWIVSGRTVADLERLVGLERIVDLWGSHGMERRTRHGDRTRAPASAAAAAFLDDVAGSLERGGAGEILERKPYGLALHRRGADPAVWRGASARLGELAADAAGHGLSLEEFDGGVELRPLGFHKGLVVERAFAELGSDAAVAYLGDDRTDEDAFAALRGRGLPVLVRAAPRRTLAEEWLRPPAEVLEFLSGWTAACSGKSSPPA